MSGPIIKITVNQGESLPLPFTDRDDAGDVTLLATYLSIELMLFPQNSRTPVIFTGVGADVEPNIVFELTPADTLALAPGLYDAVIRLTPSIAGQVDDIPDEGKLKIKVLEVS